MAPRQRIEQQPAFILHQYPWRETSLIVEAFTRNHGRVPMVAKGARRPTSALRACLMGFQPLKLDWSGGGEVKTLIRADWQGGIPLLRGRALLCGYYLNELLVRLSAREDPHPNLFDEYATTLAQLAQRQPLEPVLRCFELRLLRELGFEVPLDADADSGDDIEAGAHYVYILEHGPVRADRHHGAGVVLATVSGQTLLDMAAQRFERAETLLQSRTLLRALINHYLNGQPLESRRVFKELQEL